MPTKRITLTADSIDGAAEQIIHLLDGTDKEGDVIYFHGWNGWGASAVLKEVVKRLQSSLLGLADTGTAGGLEKIVHVDCSRWQSKRALQKAIAEELRLPQQVMALFDQRDEEDDFDGVEQSARGVIPQVRLAIMNELIAHRFLVVLHNGSGSYVDLWEVGVPVIGDLGKRVLWTSRGRFWPHVTARHGEDDVEELAGLSNVVIETAQIWLGAEDWRHILYAEIEEVAKYTNVPEPDMSPNIVTECILYSAMRGNDQDISWDSHASNYWVCDGIINDATDGGRSAWEISDALQRNMNLDLCNGCAKAICELLVGAEQQRRHIDRWVSATSRSSKEIQVPPQATSFFWTVGGPSSSTGQNTTRVLEAGMFKHSNRASSLRVIHLSHCTFSFSSPPFTSCSNLRFLLLDHCKNNDAQDQEKESHNYSHCSQQDGEACFRNLWVLELSYTDWYWLLSKDMLDLMVDLRELNVKGVGNRSMMHLHHWIGAGSNRRNLIKLRVVSDDDDGTTSSGKRNQQVVSPPVVASSSLFPDLSSWHILKTVILDGCGDLELIDCNALPLSLESFTLIRSVTSSSKIKRISFHGRTRLKSLLLRGLFDSLVELDMSGTAIRTLDLSATQAWGLERLFLLGCEKLCAILWPQEENKEIRLQILRVDTTTTTYAAWEREKGKPNKQEATTSDSARTPILISMGPSSAIVLCEKDRTITDSDSYISIRDPRLFRSFMSLRHRNKWLHMEISSTGPGHRAGTGQRINTSGGYGSAAVNVHKPGGSLYDDIIITSTSNDIIISPRYSAAAADASRDAFKALVTRSQWSWDCPPIPENPDWAEYIDWARCYISIQDEIQTELLLQGGTATSSTGQLINRAITLPAFVTKDFRTLHMHDSLSITCLPGPAVAEEELYWHFLRWCRLERCPNLEGVVFNAPQQGSAHIFCWLETFWASQLPKARYIWDWSTTSGFRPASHSFYHLVFLHLGYCPRLVHVLPLLTSNTWGCHSLEILEIVCCGDLRVVFPSDSQSQQQEQRPREFPSLKRIHLYELHKLQRICGHYRMLAPNLETFKVRGCWGLKRLPTVGRRESTPPVVDCEKDWWDGLEWDGESAGHHHSHYKPRYSSAYYKKKLLRDSVLR